jgi:ATP-dependent Clp protease ATP-binding subunit ClpC
MPLYQRFTDRSRKVISLARQEAKKRGHPYIGTEHILLGLLREGSGVAAHVLCGLKLDMTSLTTEVDKIVVSGEKSDKLLSLSENAKEAIRYATEESSKLDHHYVGTEHLLLGLVRVEGGTCNQVLKNMDLTVENIRDAVLRLLGHFEEGDEVDLLLGHIVDIIEDALKNPANYEEALKAIKDLIIKHK